MGAYVSLAFGLNDSDKILELLDSTLIDIGLKEICKGLMIEGSRQSIWELHFAGEKIPILCISYQEDGWLSTTLDVEEELFDSFEKQQCQLLVKKLTNLGIKLMQKMNLSYIFFEEEAEAHIASNDYNAECLYAITLTSDRVSFIKQACNRPDIQRVEQFDGVVVLHLRFPIPHYQFNQIIKN